MEKITTLKFLLLSLFLVLLSACSDDEDEGETIIETPFETITITFEEDFETDCGQVWTIADVNLSISPFTEDEIDPEGFNADMIGRCPFYSFQLFRDRPTVLLAQAAIEIDFSALSGVSQITIEIADNAGGTRANLYEGDEIIAFDGAIEGGLESETLVFDNISEEATRIRVWSFEGFIFNIVFE